jgi:hypothetical protein
MGSENAEIFCFSLKHQKLTGSFLHTSSHHYLTSSVLAGRNSTNNAFLTNEMQSMSIANNHNENLNVTIIKNTPADTFFLWSYVYPGKSIFDVVILIITNTNLLNNIQ